MSNVPAALLKGATLLLAVMLGACHDAGSGGAKTGLTGVTGATWLNAPGDPVEVRLTLDSGNATNRVITEKGGTLSAMGADGTFFTLQIPKGALVAPERITLTPVQRVDGLPLQGGAVAAVHVEPEGLILNRPATLVIETEQPVSPAERVAFAYAMQGRDTHLYSASGDSNETEFKLLHFSGYGFGKAPPNDPGRIRLLYASAHAAKLEAQAAAVMAEERAKALAGAEGMSSTAIEAIESLFIEYYDGVVRSIMKVAETDDRMAECAMQYYLSWRRQLALLGYEPNDAAGLFGTTGADRGTLGQRGNGGELARRLEESSASALRIILNAKSHLIERAKDECRRHDLTAYSRVIEFYRMLALLGLESEVPESLGTFMKEASEQCLRFEIEFVSEIESGLPHFAQQFRVAATVPYTPDERAHSAPLSYERFTTTGRPMEDVVGKYTPKRDGTIEDAIRTTAEQGLNYSLSAASSRPGTVGVVKVDWAVNKRETEGTGCNGRDESQQKSVADSFTVTLRIDPPTEVVHYVPVHGGALRPFNSDEHHWMRFFTRFRKGAGEAMTPPSDAAKMDEHTGEQAQLLTLQLAEREPGIWRADFKTTENQAPGSTLSETGHLILRHTPK